MHRFSRGLLAAWLVAFGAGTPEPGVARAQGDDPNGETPVFFLEPSLIQIGGEAVTVEVRVGHAPPARGFEFELAFDDGVVAVTAVEAGTFLGTTPILLRGAAPDHVTISGDIAASSSGSGMEGGEAAKDGANEGAPAVGGEAGAGSAPADEVLPEGTGVLALVTLAPLARTDGSVPVTFGRASLRGPDGEVIDADGMEAQLTIVETPGDAQLAETRAQADALAEQVVARSALGEFTDVFGRAWGDVTRRVSGAGAWIGPQVVWLALLAAALGVVGLGWYLGRRPPRAVD